MSDIQDAKIARDLAQMHVNKFYATRAEKPDYDKWLAILRKADDRLTGLVESYIKRTT